MLGRLLLIFSSVHVAYAISIQLQQTRLRFVKKRAKGRRIVGEDKISALPDDLLVHILLFLPGTKDVVATMILSKRWRSIWTMVPRLGYYDDTHKVFSGGLFGRLLGRLFDKSEQQQRCLWRFIDKSLQLHKAHVLESLLIKLGPSGDHVDVGKWIAIAVARRVRELTLMITWSAEPASLSKSLYTCDTLVELHLSNNIIVDVPSRVCLSSLKSISLYCVVYKDEDSLVRLLSNCPILKLLWVKRHHQDNVRNFNIKVTSLECLIYVNVNFFGVHNEGIGGSLVIDSPALKKFFYRDYSEDSCSIENKPCFDKANIGFLSYPDDKFMRSISSVMNFELDLRTATVVWCNAIKFSKLMECKVTLLAELEYWLESLMGLLQNCPNLKVLFIDQTLIRLDENFSLSWKEPSSVPGCFSAHLEIFAWKGYIGRSKEKEAIKYIFANTKCLKRAGISMKSTCKLEAKEKMMKELESMSRVSTSSQLLFSSQLEFPKVGYE
ncbi:F-box-like domain superfamily [Arabidopsis suecica]|uniref:F-box-like domain superfamily n=1 Tax=Arabidopsis suecica TaxID=45249 RepID=A0A8T1ZCU8_ARASU|nr:F-box-like domain superfamily [Arabidopsis suecica]